MELISDCKYEKIAWSIFLAFALSTTNIYASNSINSMRTPSGQLVSIGERYNSFISKIQLSPISTRNYEVEKDGEKYTIYEYTYLIENSYYTVSIKNNLVDSIIWDRKN